MKLLRMPGYIAGFLWHEPVEELPLLTHGGEAMSDPNFKVGPHAHAAFEFLYLSRGSIDWRIGDEVVCQQMGDLIVTFPGEVHGMDRSVSSASHRIWIGADLEELGPAGSNLAGKLRRKHIRILPRCHAAEPVMQAIIRQVVSNLPKRCEVIQNYLRVLIAVIEQRYLSMQQEQFSPEQTQLPFSYGVQKAVSYMERHLDRHIPLAELASVAVIGHIANFCAQFKKEVGMSPATYHLQLRLNAARAELLQPDVTITLVALQFGFSSSQHFSTAFRHAFGISPRVWQQKSIGQLSPVAEPPHR